MPSRRSAEGEAERLAELVLAEARRRAEEALSPATPVERVAALVAQEFEGLPAPPGFALRLARDGSEERARAVATEVARLAPGSVTALTLAAEVAGEFDHDHGRAGELLDEALDAYVDQDGAVSLAQHMLGAGRQLDALDLVREAMLEEPEDEDANEVYGLVLEQLHRRLAAGEKLGRAERDELARFAERGAVYALRDAMRSLVEERRPELLEPVSASVRDWMEELHAAQGDESEDMFGLESGDERAEALFRFAMEHAWLMEPDPDAHEQHRELPFDGVPALDGLDAPLALLVRDPDVSPEISSMAQNWLETVTYGLWQVTDPVPGPGLWLTDILTGVRRYAAIPPEQLPGITRWSVLLGALVSLDGIWRSTGAVVLLRPSEGDGAAELVHDVSATIAKALARKRARRPGRRREPQPHGVLVEVTEPMDPTVAALMSQALGTLLPGILGEAWLRRAAGPKLTNTDGHRLRMITADLTVNDPATVTEMLASHADFRTEDEGGLTWWGRELTGVERAGMLAQIHALVGDDEPIEEADQPQRWLRGRLDPHAGGFEVSVNSDERLEALVQLLRELGAQPRIERQSVIDPAQDMPPIPLGTPMPFGASQEAIDAWQSLWPDERVPALDGATPRTASRRQDSRPVLEAVLREFEHDAYPLAQADRPAPDIDRLRAELGMDAWWEPPPHAHGRA
ncbi:MAG: tetratricopeptide repeat protein [Solirubrobacteraceae bacterium]